jgi:hypothetical protein
MNTEIYQIIDEYMEWGRPGVGMVRKYDSNDASLCVQKMVENGDWFKFLNAVTLIYKDEKEFIAWLFNADNFFAAMAEFLLIKRKRTKGSYVYF